MDALILTGFILGVLGLMAWLFTVIGVAYAIYKYVYAPWKIMRADVSALNDAVKSLAAQVQRAAVLAHDDGEIARIEARMNARARARNPEAR